MVSHSRPLIKLFDTSRTGLLLKTLVLLLLILFTAQFGPPNGSMQAGVLLWEKLNEKTRSRATLERRRSPALCPAVVCLLSHLTAYRRQSHFIVIFTTPPAAGMGGSYSYPPYLSPLRLGTVRGPRLRLAIAPPPGRSFFPSGPPLYVLTCFALLGYPYWTEGTIAGCGELSGLPTRRGSAGVSRGPR